jgi:hypothetical protein
LHLTLPSPWTNWTDPFLYVLLCLSVIVPQFYYTNYLFGKRHTYVSAFVQNKWSKWSWKATCKVIILAVVWFTQLIFVFIKCWVSHNGGKNCLRSELLKSLYYKDCTYIGNLWQDESYGCRTLPTTLTWHLSFLTKSIGLFSMSGCGSAEMTCTVCKEHHTQWHHCHSCFRHNCISAISVLSGYHCTVFTALSF